MRHRQDDDTVYDICRVFLFIGADPNTAWLGDCGVKVDAKAAQAAVKEALNG